MAFKNVLRELFKSSKKGSFKGYFLEPQRTECSKMCAIPVLSFGGVLKFIPKTLFSSSFNIENSLAPVSSCSYKAALDEISSISLCSMR